tara:strand:- start:67 stop:378 length:312 start_codon:yes stop_codon:yes gene_type:complete
MKSYIKGVLSGAMFTISLLILTASNPIQLDAIENEIIKIWKKDKTQDDLIINNEFQILDLESQINIHLKSINLYVKSLQKQVNKLTNQLNENCECYRNQILIH